MHLNPDSPTKSWHADLPSEELTQFRQLFPMDSARIWVYGLALEKFLARAENEPELRQWVHLDIAEMMVNRAVHRRLTPIIVRLPTEITARYLVLFPERGSATWFLRKIMSTLVSTLTQEGFELESVVERIVNKAVEHAPETSEIWEGMR